MGDRGWSTGRSGGVGAGAGLQVGQGVWGQGLVYR